MKHVRIYQPAKTATQSGLAKTKKWVLEYERAYPKSQFALTGWTSARDMNRQVRLQFPTKEAAVSYAEHEQLLYSIMEPKLRVRKPKNYSNNFTRPIL